MNNHKLYPELCPCGYYSVKQTSRILRFHPLEPGECMIEILEDTERKLEEL